MSNNNNSEDENHLILASALTLAIALVIVFIGIIGITMWDWGYHNSVGDSNTKSKYPPVSKDMQIPQDTTQKEYK